MRNGGAPGDHHTGAVRNSGDQRSFSATLKAHPTSDFQLLNQLTAAGRDRGKAGFCRGGPKAAMGRCQGGLRFRDGPASRSQQRFLRSRPQRLATVGSRRCDDAVQGMARGDRLAPQRLGPRPAPSGFRPDGGRARHSSPCGRRESGLAPARPAGLKGVPCPDPAAVAAPARTDAASTWASQPSSSDRPRRSRLRDGAGKQLFRISGLAARPR